MAAFPSACIKSWPGVAVLLACLASHGAAFAQASADLDSLQTPPRALADPPPLMADAAAPIATQGPEQRVALVIGNASYQNVPPLENPDHDAQSVAQLLNSAGFEVIAATDLTQTEMVKVVQDFSTRVAAHGSNTVAMIYYAGHGVQLAGENYLTTTHPTFARNPGRFRLDSGPHFAQSGSPRTMGSDIGRGGGHGFR